MILQRTYILYLLAMIILLNITNFEHVHARRLNKLETQDNYFKGNNYNVAINYWNYRRRLDPNDIPALKALSVYYLLAKDNADARETINNALCIVPQNYKDRPMLLRAYINLAGNDKIYCNDK